MREALAGEEFGVAIAAPQLGEPLQLFVVAGRVFAMEEDAQNAPDKVFINPEIVRTSRLKREMTEGCLSVRNKYGAVVRHEKATVRAYNEKGEPFIYHGSGLVAQIFQHECDHLEGILYIDKAAAVVDDENWKELREKRKIKK
jgi:peptide deformylase